MSDKNVRQPVLPLLGRRAVLAGTALTVGLSGLAGAADIAATPRRNRRIGGLTFGWDTATQASVSLIAEADRFEFLPIRPATDDTAGSYRLGDIDLRVRTAGGPWQDYSTAFNRRPVVPLPVDGKVFAAADLSHALPGQLPIAIERRWIDDDGTLVLRFTLRNRAETAVEIGGLGVAMVFDNILTGRSLQQAHEKASFADPYIGLDAGYVQVTRLNGRGPVLIVLPEAGTPFEAWKPIADHDGKTGGARLLEDPLKRSLTFEGFNQWMVTSRGFAEREWRSATQWNDPTSIMIQPGEQRTFGFRFVTAPGIRAIESRLAAAGHPVAIGIPGYVLPTDLDTDLFLDAPAIAGIDVSPPGAIDLTERPKRGRWVRYRLRGRLWGRARITIRYADGRRQAVHCFVTKPCEQVAKDLGRFLFTHHWYDVSDDRFGRSPSIMSFDRDRNAIVREEQRVWIAGLSDEGGAGSWLAAIMKQLDNPDAAELAKFERFHVGVIERHLQTADGPERDGVRKSLFWYDPARPKDYDPAIDWTTWASWKPDQARSVGRSFNYVHVAAAQWVLYRLARNHVGLVTAHDWRWYLTRAARTTVAMHRLAPDYVGFGQMEGDVFVAILADLRREGMTEQADAIEAVMRTRADAWSKEAYPFGSEMPWDSTGQEEVYAWMRHFGDDAKAALTREVILGYDPLIPHWGYNGSARRYWDFLFAGKTARIERQLHHYGSSLNALPLFDSYRRDPADFHLLRVAYGGLMGSLTNIDRDGFGSAAFHSFPDMLRFDGYSGDYGMSFFGHVFGTAAYLVDHPVFGWIAFGGSVEEGDGSVRLAPRDSARRRVFLAPSATSLTLESGKLAGLALDPATGIITLTLDPRDAHTVQARLVIASPATTAYRPDPPLPIERGAIVVALADRRTTIRLVPSHA